MQARRRSGSDSKLKRYWARIPAGTNVYNWGCSYTVLQTIQRPGVCSALYGTMHYGEPLKSFGKSRAAPIENSPYFGLSSVEVLPLSCRKRQKAIYSLTHSLAQGKENQRMLLGPFRRDKQVKMRRTKRIERIEIT